MIGYSAFCTIGFQLTAARRRLVLLIDKRGVREAVSTHSRPKAAGNACGVAHKSVADVSTHSRPKAAGFGSGVPRYPLKRFNSQPPEGGWF